MEFFEYKNEKIMFPGKMFKFYVLMGTICNRDMNPRHRAKAPTMQLVRSDKLSDSNTPLNQVTLFCPHSNKGGH